MLELDVAGRRREDRVVVAEASPVAGEERHPPLANDDGAGGHELAVAGLDAEPLANAVAAVLRRAACLLVGHRSLLVLLRARARGLLVVRLGGRRLGGRGLG